MSTSARPRRARLVVLLALLGLVAALAPSVAAQAAAPRGWTTATLTLLPRSVAANAKVPFAVTLAAGGAAGRGAVNRVVVVERSTDKRTWVSVARSRTDGRGVARGSFAALASGSMFVRFSVPAAGSFKAGAAGPVYVKVVGAARPDSVWTSVGLVPTPKEVAAPGAVDFQITVKAGGAPGADGRRGRSVLVERSTDKATWTAATDARLTTDAKGIAKGSTAGLEKSGSLYLRATVAASGPFKTAKTSPVYVKILPQYQPTEPEAEAVAPTGRSVTSTLFGVHPIDGDNPVAGTVRLWDTSTHWAATEPGDDAYSWWTLDAKVAEAEANHQEILLVLGGTPTWAAGHAGNGSEFAGVGSSVPPDPEKFADYVEAVVERYGSRIAAYQVWNEANIPSFWQGTAEQMADLAKVAYDTVKRLQPGAVVVAASTGSRWVSAFSEFFPAYLRALGARGWPVDAYAVHLYPLPSGSPKDRAYLFGMVEKALADTGAPARPVWETEINYGVTNPGLGESARFIPDGEIPTYVARTYLDSLRYGIERSYWYAWTPSYRLLGIQMWNGFTAANTFNTVADWLIGSTFFGCTTSGVVVDCSFTRDGAPFHVYYTDDGSAATTAAAAGLSTVRHLNGSRLAVTGPVAVTAEPVLVS